MGANWWRSFTLSRGIQGHEVMALSGRNGIIFGVANKWSLAWSVAKRWQKSGANVALVCASERIADSVKKMVQREEVDLDIPEGVGNACTTSSVSAMTVHTCDVTCDESVKILMQELNEERFSGGKLHSILHSVAFSPTGTLTKNFTNITFDEYTKTQDASAYSLLRLCKYAKPWLVAGAAETRGGSCVLSLTFIGSSICIPNYHVVGVAKSALESSTRYLASELGKHNVRVNAISPGPINTAAARGIPKFRDFEKHVKKNTLLNRNTSLEDVASVATFLASEEAASITGQTLFIDCGFNVSSSIHTS
eukprot:g5579.t1